MKYLLQLFFYLNHWLYPFMLTRDYEPPLSAVDHFLKQYLVWIMHFFCSHFNYLRDRLTNYIFYSLIKKLLISFLYRQL